MIVETILTGLGLGVGLAMDAFAVSMSNGLKCNKIGLSKTILIALTFAIFQAVMPLIGYFVGHAFISYIEKFLPWIALALLSFLGIKMIVDAIKEKGNEEKDLCCVRLTFKLLIIQAIATSIDALSTGLTFSNFNVFHAVLCVLIIGLITFIICFIGVFIGKKFGTKLSSYSDILGGVILVLIGIIIFIKGMI